MLVENETSLFRPQTESIGNDAVLTLELETPNVTNNRNFKLRHRKRKLFIIAVLCSIMYLFVSGGLTLFNKWYFSTRGFNFPIFVVMGTMVVHRVTTYVLRQLSDCCNEASLPKKKQEVNSLVYRRYLVPIGLFTGLEIASSNLALVRLSVVSQFHSS